jgi:hypothetical protein
MFRVISIRGFRPQDHTTVKLAQISTNRQYSSLLLSLPGRVGHDRGSQGAVYPRLPSVIPQDA